MGVINKTTDEINTLLDKLDNMPEEGVVGKTPVLETGETTTLPAGSQATSFVVANGTDSNGNPKYKLNFGIPKGADGAGSSGQGGISEAPTDGRTYGRNNGTWVEVEATAVNVSEIWNRVVQSAKAGTKISQEDYNTLLGYAQNGSILYASAGGTSMKFELSYIGSILCLSSSIPSGSEKIIYECALINPDLTITISEGLIATTQSATETIPMDGYTKAENYSAITTEDTINSAIGKLEAGIGSGGSSNDYVISSSGFLSISPTDDSESLLSKIGATYSDLLQAISDGKKIYVNVKSFLSKGLIPIEATISGVYIVITAILSNTSGIDVNGNSRLVSIILSESNATLKHFSYLNGYTLNSGIDTLDTSSTDDDIKAVLPVSSLPELLALSKLGCRFRMPITQGYLSGGTIDAMFTIAKDESTQDYVIQISGAAYGLYGNASFGSRIISYEAASNTYKVIA